MLLALAPLAHALDAARVAPALEAQFAPTAAYLDCPFHQTARTCVLLPQASSMRGAYADVLAFVRAVPGLVSIDRQGAPSSLAFVVGDTAYQLRLAGSRARPGVLAATLSFAFDRQSAFNVACLRTEALFDDARLASLSPASYAAMATAIACHGADPVDARGRTPLVMAVDSRNLDAVRALLRGGADPNHITQRGWTPLLFAARNGTSAILDALSRAGADPSYIAPDGATIGTLEPFNPRLATAPGPLAISGLAPRIPVALFAAGTRSVPAVSGSAGGRTAGTSAEGTDTPGTGASGPEARGPSSSVAAPSGGDSRLPVIALEMLALTTVASLALLRFRRRGPGGRRETEPVAWTATQTDLPAMQVPDPLRRQRSRRHLEPAPGADDRAF
ncbi:MAG: ankyrin repeat domain-containing protein [Deinococcales bacterium]